MLFALLLALEEAKPDCNYDRPAMLALSEDAFDQDLQGGWRALDLRGCHAEAAELLEAYRQEHPGDRPWLLAWHEGQVRASIGQTAAALALFEQSRKPPTEDKAGWNHYVDGTIAFLKQDRRGLEAARARLAALPPPAKGLTMTISGKSVPVPWPLNLNVLDGFLACFGKSYQEAYGPGCSKPMKVEVKN